jgi:recombinational DNA repair ATPase RecF
MTRITRLQMENFKRIQAIDITPSGDVITLSGRNAQGKTSILDGIFAALDGAAARKSTSQPIRDGQDTAIVRLELDEHIITRRWTKDDAGTLTVTAKDGAKYRSPQAVLDALVGKLTFDPLAFAGMKPAEQVAALVATVELPFDPDQLERERKGMYDRRTEINRDVTKLEGQLAGFPSVDPSLPPEPVSAADIIAEREKAATHNSNIQRATDLAAELARAVETSDRIIADLEQKLADQRAERESREARRAAAAELAASAQPKDLAAITERLVGVEELNERIRTQARRAEVAAELSARREASGKLTAELQLSEKRKAEALAAVTFPVPGLGFDDSGVTLNGIPFSQASAAEKWRVSLALGMAANPDLRIMQVRDGSLLDSESMRIVEEMAAEKDYQVWVEVVDESGEVGITIEDGQVRA